MTKTKNIISIYLFIKRKGREYSIYNNIGIFFKKQEVLKKRKPCYYDYAMTEKKSTVDEYRIVG